MKKTILSILILMLVFTVFISCNADSTVDDAFRKRENSADTEEDDEEVKVGPFISFSSSDSFSLKINNTTKNWDGTLEYSFDADFWEEWNGEEINSQTKKNKYVIYLRGKDNTHITGLPSPATKRLVITTQNTNKVKCSGDIRTLLNHDNPEQSPMDNFCFGSLFAQCSALETAPALPTTTLTESCYNSMFNGCSSLVSAPALPATTLAQNCYYSMFSGCSSLVSAPALPATTLAQNCYSGMFRGCSSLVAAPELPATTLAPHCYNSMFRECSSLVAAPALPVTTLTQYCYSGMFSGCSSLVSAPALSATTLTAGCYKEMFSGCSSLEIAPELSATTLASSCYEEMFKGSGLKTPPVLPATELADYCYHSMFSQCRSLQKVPALPATTLVRSCYHSMFYQCGETLCFYNDPGSGRTAYVKIDASSDYCSAMFDGCGGGNIYYVQDSWIYTSNEIVGP